MVEADGTNPATGPSASGARIAAPGGQAAGPGGQAAGGLWHVLVTVAGPRADLAEVAGGLERLCAERAFLLSCRYGEDRAELSYWEEADDLDDAAALALRLWGEHQGSAGLPPWHVVGLEVLDREAFHWRVAHRRGAELTLLGVHPFWPSERV